MDKKLQLIRHLYEEADEETKLNSLLEDPELKQEFQSLSEAKFWLDHSKREKPSDETLQAVLSMAMEAESAAQRSKPASSTRSSATRRSDRNAVPRQRAARKRPFGVTAFVMATLITAFVGYQWFTSGNPLLGPVSQPQALQENTTASEADLAGQASRPDVSSDQALEAKEEAAFAVSPEGRAPSLSQRAFADSEAPSSGGLQPASIDSMPGWDRSDEIILYKQRIDMLLEQNQDIAWDETAVPLESLRTTRPSDRQLLQAGSRANNN